MLSLDDKPPQSGRFPYRIESNCDKLFDKFSIDAEAAYGEAVDEVYKLRKDPTARGMLVYVAGHRRLLERGFCSADIVLLELIKYTLDKALREKDQSLNIKDYLSSFKERLPLEDKVLAQALDVLEHDYVTHTKTRGL
jgi:hypothetical protein